MKKVLFLSNTIYNFQQPETVSHLKNKFEGLSQGCKPYVLARGRPFHKEIWGTHFYLLRPGMFFWVLACLLGFWLCLAKKIDTIIAQSPSIEGFLGAIWKMVLKKELIVEAHGEWLEGPFLVRQRRCERLLKKLVLIFTKISLKSADKIRVVAEYLKEKAQKFVPQKPYFIFHTFTDLDRFLAVKDTSFSNYILFVGGLYQIKGVDILIRAFSKIHEEFSGFKLILVGDGPALANYKLQITNYKLENRVDFRGKLSLEETKGLMKNCYCLVLPSLSEGMPRVLLEGMALGKPLVGSNIGGIPEVIKDGENGFLFEKGNSNELAEKLRVLLQDKEQARRLGERGREMAQREFSNEKYIRNYIGMINS